MAAADAPQTLSELRTAFLESLKEVTGNSTVNTIADRFLNQALADFELEHWPWQERRAVLLTKAPYTTGTVAVTQGGTAVTGASTAWATADAFGQNNARDLDKITIGSHRDVYVISGTPTATAITLASRYTGTTVTAGTYAVYQDEYALESDFDGFIDTRFFDESRTITLFGPQELYRRYARNATRRKPQFAGLIQLGPGSTVASRPRALLVPAPDAVYTIPYRYWSRNRAVSTAGTQAINLSATTDEPIMPVKYRSGIVWRGLELWFSTRQKNPGLAGDFKGRYVEVLARARQDTGKGQDRMRLTAAVAGYVAGARYPYTGRGRYGDGGSEFDQLLDRAGG